MAAAIVVIACSVASAYATQWATKKYVYDLAAYKAAAEDIERANARSACDYPLLKHTRTGRTVWRSRCPLPPRTRRPLVQSLSSSSWWASAPTMHKWQ